MSNAFFNVPKAVNEPVKGYAPGSPEKAELEKALKELKSSKIDAPMIIGGKEVRTGNTVSMHPPHDLSHDLGVYHRGDASHVRDAIDAALAARDEWAALP